MDRGRPMGYRPVGMSYPDTGPVNAVPPRDRVSLVAFVPVSVRVGPHTRSVQEKKPQVGAMSRGTTTSGPRTLAGYLALPRPGDLSKSVIVPLGFVTAMATTGLPTLHQVLRALVVWFAVEYLAYQARYQWNDIRGFHSDQAHPDRDRRGRLPGPPDRAKPHIAASVAVLCARVAAAVLLVVALPGLRLAPVLLPAVAAVFAVALVYEALRGRAARGSAGPPRAAVLALWGVSGAGYCVRGLTGVVRGAATGVSPVGSLVAGATCWLWGIVFVTPGGRVESVPFARRSGSKLHWHAEPE